MPFRAGGGANSLSDSHFLAPRFSYVCSLKYLYKVIDLLFYLTDNDDLCCRSIEPVTEFIMSVR